MKMLLAYKGKILLPLLVYLSLALILSSCVQIPVVDEPVVNDQTEISLPEVVSPSIASIAKPKTQIEASNKPAIITDKIEPNIVQQRNSARTIDMVKAASEGHIQLLEQGLLQGHKMLNQRDERGNTPLIAAASNGHDDVVLFLIDNHADVNLYAHNGSDALMMASQSAYDRIVSHLLLAGSDVQHRDVKGESALFYAVKNGQIMMVYTLLDHDADPNVISKADAHRGYTPLMYVASQNGTSTWLEIASLLLDYGAKPNLSPDTLQVTGETAWKLAKQQRHPDMMATLRASGAIDDEARLSVVLSIESKDAVSDTRNKPRKVISADPPLATELNGIDSISNSTDAPKKHGDTLLIAAIRDGLTDTVKQLLKNGVSYNRPNSQHETPGLIAARSGEADIMNMLITSGLDPDSAFTNPENDYYIAGILRQEEARVLLIEASLNDHAETVRVIVEKGGNVNVADQDGRTALSWAAEKGFVRTATMLIDYDIDIDKRDNLARTALIYAAINGHIDIVRLLLERGAKKNIGLNGGETALVAAKKNGHDAVARLISGYR